MGTSITTAWPSLTYSSFAPQIPHFRDNALTLHLSFLALPQFPSYPVLLSTSCLCSRQRYILSNSHQRETTFQSCHSLYSVFLITFDLHLWQLSPLNLLSLMYITFYSISPNSMEVPWEQGFAALFITHFLAPKIFLTQRHSFIFVKWMNEWTN